MSYYIKNEDEDSRGFSVIEPVLRGPADPYKTSHDDIVDKIKDPAAQAIENEKNALAGSVESEEEFRIRMMAGLAAILFAKHNNTKASPEVVVRRLYALFLNYLPEVIDENPTLSSVAGELEITKQGLSKIKLKMSRDLNGRAQYATTQKQRDSWAAAQRKRHAERKEQAALMV